MCYFNKEVQAPKL